MKEFDLQFPLGGLNKRYAHQQQPPYTSPDLLNVVPDDSDEARARGGSRPGIIVAFQPAGVPPDVQNVRLLDTVTIVENNGVQIFSALFPDGVGDGWNGGQQ